jgi:hypothetical protein
VLHPWLQAEVTAIVDTLPPVDGTPSAANGRQWEAWQDGLTIRPTLPTAMPPFRMLLIWDHLAGHKTPELIVWLFRHGVMPLYTPLGGAWLNMAESIQRIVQRRALDGSHPTTTDEIIGWVEAVVAVWNRTPTPFEWGGKRAARRVRSRERRQRLGGSGACTRRPLRRTTIVEQWQSTRYMPH